MAVNVGQPDPFKLVRGIVPADKGEHAAAKNQTVGHVNEPGNNTVFEGEASPTVPLDALAHNNDHGTIVGGLGDRNHLGGGRALDGRSGGGLFRLNFIFSAENGGHAVTIGNDVFPALVTEKFRAALFPVTKESNGFGGALHDFDCENTIMVASAGVVIFVADFKSKHSVYLLYIKEKLVCSGGPCRRPFRVGP